MSLDGKSVLVTGACGTIGSAIVKRCTEQSANRIICFDRDDIGLFMLRKKYDTGRIELAVGDIRNLYDLNQIKDFPHSDLIDYCFHTAAMKHVTTCQWYPQLAADINVLGTQNVVDFCKQRGIHLVNISTDKAAEPNSVMGATKLISEQLVSNAGFTSVRFGNVASSRGSVIPVWVDSLRNHKPIYISSAKVTRFLMTTNSAVSLVTEAASMRPAIYILKMHSFVLGDLLDVFCRKITKALHTVTSVKVTGISSGEKLHETLTSNSELSYVKDLGSMYRIGRTPYSPPMAPITSDKADKFSKDELEQIVRNYLKER